MKHYPNNSDTIGTQLNDAIAVLDKELSYYEEQRAENLITHDVFMEHLSRVEGGMKAFIFAKQCCEIRMQEYEKRINRVSEFVESGTVTIDEYTRLKSRCNAIITELKPNGMDVINDEE